MAGRAAMSTEFWSLFCNPNSALGREPVEIPSGQTQLDACWFQNGKLFAPFPLPGGCTGSWDAGTGSTLDVGVSFLKIGRRSLTGDKKVTGITH